MGRQGLRWVLDVERIVFFDEIFSLPKTRYILGLQEATLVLIANGYAVATQKPTAVQLHCSVGTGNALGSLYQVFRKQRSPRAVIAGEAGVAYDALEAQCGSTLRISHGRWPNMLRAPFIRAACFACCDDASRWRRRRRSDRRFWPSPKISSTSKTTSRCCEPSFPNAGWHPSRH